MRIFVLIPFIAGLKSCNTTYKKVDLNPEIEIHSHNEFEWNGATIYLVDLDSVFYEYTKGVSNQTRDSIQVEIVDYTSSATMGNVLAIKKAIRRSGIEKFSYRLKKNELLGQ